MTTASPLGDVTIKQLQARLPGLLVFQCVAHHLNFARAADELLVTPTAVSKAIRQLEDQLGVRLFNRTTRSTALTEAGAKLALALKPALQQLAYSLEAATEDSGQPAGLLRINSAFVPYATLIEPHLPSFLARYPGIRFEVSLDSHLADIVGGGFDAGIRLGHAVQRDMVALPIGPVQTLIAVASPAYLSEHGRPEHPHDLLQHRCIRQRLTSQGKFFEWTFQARGKPVVIDIDGHVVVDEMRLAAGAAVRGIGVAYVFRQFVEAELQLGVLEALLGKFAVQRGAFHLYYPSIRQMPGKLRVFIDYMRAANG